MNINTCEKIDIFYEKWPFINLYNIDFFKIWNPFRYTIFLIFNSKHQNQTSHDINHPNFSNEPSTIKIEDFDKSREFKNIIFLYEL